MQKSYESGLATHIGLESCGAAREGGVEALTGERAGRVFSRVRKLFRDADAAGQPATVTVLRQTIRKRLQTKLNEVKAELQRRMHEPSPNKASGCGRLWVDTFDITECPRTNRR